MPLRLFVSGDAITYPSMLKGSFPSASRKAMADELDIAERTIDRIFADPDYRPYSTASEIEATFEERCVLASGREPMAFPIWIERLIGHIRDAYQHEDDSVFREFEAVGYRLLLTSRPDNQLEAAGAEVARAMAIVTRIAKVCSKSANSELLRGQTRSAVEDLVSAANRLDAMDVRGTLALRVLSNLAWVVYEGRRSSLSETERAEIMRRVRFLELSREGLKLEPHIEVYPYNMLAAASLLMSEDDCKHAWKALVRANPAYKCFSYKSPNMTRSIAEDNDFAFFRNLIGNNPDIL